MNSSFAAQEGNDALSNKKESAPLSDKDQFASSLGENVNLASGQVEAGVSAPVSQGNATFLTKYAGSRFLRF